MLSLVKFDNGEYYIARSKAVKVIQGEDCLVKYRGTKYCALLVKTSDSEDDLTKFRESLETESSGADDRRDCRSDSVKLGRVSDTNKSHEIHSRGCSTPINADLLPPRNIEITLSDIVDSRQISTTFPNISAVSSSPPTGCTDIMDIVGDDWVKDSCERNEHSVNSKILDDNSNYLVNPSDKASLNPDGANEIHYEEQNNEIEPRPNEEQDTYKNRDSSTEKIIDNTRESNEKLNDHPKQADDNETEYIDGIKDRGTEKVDDILPTKSDEVNGYHEKANKNNKPTTNCPVNITTGNNDLISMKNNLESDNDMRIDNDDESEKQMRTDEGNASKELRNDHHYEYDGIQDLSDNNNYGKIQNDDKESSGEEENTDSESHSDEDGKDESAEDSDYVPPQTSPYHSSAEDSDNVPHESCMNQRSLRSQCNATKVLSMSSMKIPPIDVRTVKIPPSTDHSRRNLKTYFCPYCRILQKKFARHLQLKHKSEADVQKFIALPPGNHERAKIIETIRKYGNFIHNTNPKLNTGILITCRRRQPKFDRDIEDYTCCSKCKGFFPKQTIRLHSVKCNVERTKGVRDIAIAGRRLTGYMHECANDVLRYKVFPVLRDDHVTMSIKYDELLILFGNKLCDKYTHVHQHDMIRAQLRLLGRFKCAIKDINAEIDDFASIFHPKYYDAAVLAVRQCAKYDPVTQIFKTPAVATMLGTLIRKCISRRKAQCIKKQDYDGKKNAEEFLTLFEDDYPTTISKKVIDDQTKQKRHRKVILPSNQDIRRLYDYLKKKCQTSLRILTKQFDLSHWKVLTECTLLLVQMFNRRRAGEIERLLIRDYENQTELDENVNADIYAKLSEESREYAKQFVRITIRGKLGRTVPVLLYPLHVACIDAIFKYRTEAGVQSNNEYIFSVPGANQLKKNYLRACPLMRKYSTECGAIIPSSLRGTKLRKHIATYFAMEGIGENEVGELANFMGHDKQIHKDVYRVPIPIREMTHVSRLLQTAIGQSEDEGSTENTSCDEQPENESELEQMPRRNAYAESFDSDSENDDQSNNNASTHDSEHANNSNSKRRSTSPYGKTKRKRWTAEEQKAVRSIFGDLATLIKLPSLSDCQKAIQTSKALAMRKPQVLKTWIDNQRKMQFRRKVSK